MFILRDKDSKISAVYLHFRKAKDGIVINIKYAAGISISPSWWNPVKQRLKEEYGIPWKKYNDKINKVDITLRQILIDYDFRQLSNEFLRNELDMRITGNKKSSLDFISYSGIEMLGKYRSSVLFSDLNYSFMASFVLWMEKDKKKYSRNYISKIVTLIKAKVNLAVKEGLISQSNISSYSYPSEPVQAVYLSEKELDLIEKVQLSKRLDISRDLFLVGCYTGLRVENYLSIDPDIHINRDEGYIQAIVNKNGPKVKIPIHRVIHSILDKYSGLPDPPCVQAFNINIKSICDKAGIRDLVEVARTRGGERVIKAYPKYKLVSSHTARRSLATNLYLRKVPLRYIMSITGHKTETMCLYYIKAGLDELYEDVAKLDFWK